MRFCPQCGAALLAEAKFCVECGRALDSAASGAGESGSGRPALGRSAPITNAFVLVFAAITVVGLGAAAWIYLRTPEVVREQVAVAPPAAVAPGAPPAANPAAAAPDTGAQAQQNAAANPAAGGSQNGGLPPGHPRIELPTEARTFVDKIEKDAQARPRDVAAWNKFGAVAMRAAMFDQSYYGKAQEAYGHVLALEPDNLDALRGIGDIDYDKQHYDEAIAAYEHYLKKKPDDPEVRTDLGTMYLYTGNADQAIVQYKKAIAAKPGFFQAYYNMGIAYGEENKLDESIATLKQAIALAPDDTARNQVKDLIAKLTATPTPSPAMQAASAPTPTTTTSLNSRAPIAAAVAQSVTAPGSPAAPVAQFSRTPLAAVVAPTATTTASPAKVAAQSKAAVSSTPTSAAAVEAQASESPAATPTPGAKDFHGAIEHMARGLPVAGPKVSSVEWPDQLKAKVLMDNFPMDQMPPFAKTKFLDDLKAGIDSAKKDNNITSPVELKIVDGASGRVMETITQ
jgi:tetratricopeptide (TPR) repeat protein